jgi:Cys-tRNA(Pro)/Cys-tRNA(Cys) deacylase
MKKRFPTFIEETCQLYDSIAVSAGERGHQIYLSPMDLAKITDAKLVDIIA